MHLTAVAAMLSQMSNTRGLKRKPSIADQVLNKLLIGVLAATISLPVTVVLDQLFWKSQRMKNTHRQHGQQSSKEVQMIARAALSV